MSGHSIIEFFQVNEREHCGYCESRNASLKKSGDTTAAETKKESKSCTLGVWAHSLSAGAYGQLLDYGFRRSGSYVYKPIMDKTCCPQYTIRLDTSRFILSRCQKRTLNHMNNFLKNGTRPKEMSKGEGKTDNIEDDQMKEKPEKPVIKGMNDKSSIRDRSLKKKEKRRAKCIERWRKQGLNVEDMQRRRMEREEARKRTIESFLLPNDSTFKHTLEMRLVATKDPEFEQRRLESFQLFCKYQSTIHKDDDKTEANYRRFLVDTPIPMQRGALRSRYGSYHMWYLLDDRLVAVGVVDLLPNCLSSKYMYYDPDYAFLNMGTYTALREIAFVRELTRNNAEFLYYYMGFYIDDCPKMRYKGTFRPSELLCDRTRKWLWLDECLKMIRANGGKFTAFYPEESTKLSGKDVQLLVNRTLCTMDMFQLMNQQLCAKRKITEIFELLKRYLPPVRDLVVYIDALQSSASNEDSEDEKSSDS